MATAAVSFPWTRLTLRQQDTRGGRISASGGLNLEIDNNAPTSSVTSVQNNAVVRKDLIIGGTASDLTSAVGGVEISINNGAWQAAKGAATWSFSLAGYTGSLSIHTRATDQVGNVETPGVGITIRVDDAAPQLTITAPANTVVPPRTPMASGRSTSPAPPATLSAASNPARPSRSCSSNPASAWRRHSKLPR